MKNLVKITLVITLICTTNLVYGQTYAAPTGVTSSAGAGGNQNVHVGYNAGGNANTTGVGNVAVGKFAATKNVSGNYNVSVGLNAGRENRTGTGNVNLGYQAGRLTNGGSNNFMLGTSSGYKNITGSSNVYLGKQSGNKATAANQNVAIGEQSLYYNLGSFNTAVGYRAGYNSDGVNNVFLGYQAGQDEAGDNRLYISNSSTSAPLIYGEFDNERLVLNGKVGINTNTFPSSVGGANTSGYQLYVGGGVLAEEVRIRTGWADYVFKDDYSLSSLDEIEKYIDQHGHLPNIPSATQVESEGIEMGEITKLQQEKIEELTLHTIRQQKEIDELKSAIQHLLEQKK